MISIIRTKGFPTMSCRLTSAVMTSIGGGRCSMSTTSTRSSLVTNSKVFPLLSFSREEFPHTGRRKMTMSSAASSSTNSTTSIASFFEKQQKEEASHNGVDHNLQNHGNGERDTESSLQTHRESWMANLGRNDDDVWLSGPRGSDWFTGVHPLECPGVDSEGKLHSLPLPNLNNVTRESLRNYFDNTWTLHETLFAGLKGEEPFYRPPVHGLRHPQIFYYGHSPCLYINKLRVAEILTQPVNRHFESIFEVGVDEMLWDDMHKNDMIWPTVSEVHKYRAEVYKTVRNVIDTHPLLEGPDPIKVDWDHPLWTLFMAFEHERIHLETSSVLFRETPIHLVQTPKNWPPLHPSSESGSPTSHPVENVHFPSNPMLPGTDKTDLNTAKVKLGKPSNFPSYGWDNEYGRRVVNVPPFQASKFMVTNGEYWKFVADGGYRKEEFWCEDGWAWRNHRNMKWPFFWESDGPEGSFEYTLRTIFKIIPMQWDWPVDVNYYEAKAYCRWKGKKDGLSKSQTYRVLTEAEHHILRHKSNNIDAVRSGQNCDQIMASPTACSANLNLRYSSQNPVDTFPPSHTGHQDVAGNAWEWTEDNFNPLPGFKVHEVYDDFSTPCFDGQHFMIVGGSFISTGDEASVFARFHFRPHFLQHSGFRLVFSEGEAPATKLNPTENKSNEEVDSPKDPASSYESKELLDMYLGFHFPSSSSARKKSDNIIDPILPHDHSPTHGVRFAQRVAQLLVSLSAKRSNNRALDVGCSVGGSAFELARSFDFVDAFDFSDTFISAAKKMQCQERLTFQIPIEGDIHEEVVATHEEGMNRKLLEKVHFFTGDACQLSNYASNGTLGTYDAVLLSNLLCRLPNPLSCLDGLPSVLNQGGVALILTPYTWLEQFTNRCDWLGGYRDPVTNEAIFSKNRLKMLMEERGFERIHEEQIPLVIREHQRKYQYIVSEATGWRKV